ncbi:MAG: nicotinic acid mononucleotide adenylyltransferase [Citrobacter freundii]|nr:MAG: nicotinic acid mononucleotide adenylyltransferase [Citrobacter freundii]
MKIGLYFGSFNPVHIGHLIIANHLLNETGIEKIWFILSPQNPFKVNHSLLNEYDRLHLLQIATADDPRIKVSDIEFSLPKPSFTSVTLAHLSERYPEHEFSIIMGSDSFQNLNKWKNVDSIISNYSIYVYIRPGFPIENSIGAKLVELDAPLLQISATGIRELIRHGKSIRYMVPENVIEEIEKGGYYKNKKS